MNVPLIYRNLFGQFYWSHLVLHFLYNWGTCPPMKSNSNLKIRIYCDIIFGFPSWIPSFRFVVWSFPMDSRLLTGESTSFNQVHLVIRSLELSFYLRHKERQHQNKHWLDELVLFELPFLPNSSSVKHFCLFFICQIWVLLGACCFYGRQLVSLFFNFFS